MAPCFQDWGISINLHPDSLKAKALGLPSPVGPAAVYRLVPSFSGLDLYSDLLPTVCGHCSWSLCYRTVYDVAACRFVGRA